MRKAAGGKGNTTNIFQIYSWIRDSSEQGYREVTEEEWGCRVPYLFPLYCQEWAVTRLPPKLPTMGQQSSLKEPLTDPHTQNRRWSLLWTVISPARWDGVVKILFYRWRTLAHDKIKKAEMTDSVNKGKTVNAVELDSRKAFDTVSHSTLVAKVVMCAPDKWIISWAENSLDHHGQRMVNSDTKFNWWLFACGIPQGFILGPTLLNGFINDLDSRIKDIFSWASWCMKNWAWVISFALTAMKVIYLWTILRRLQLLGWGEVIFTLYFSLVGPHLEYCVLFLSYGIIKTDILAWVQWRAIKMMRELGHLMYNKRLKEPGGSVLKGKGYGKITLLSTATLCKGVETMEPISSEVHIDTMKGNKQQQEHGKFWLETRKNMPWEQSNTRTDAQGVCVSIPGDTQNLTTATWSKTSSALHRMMSSRPQEAPSILQEPVILSSPGSCGKSQDLWTVLNSLSSSSYSPFPYWHGSW